MHDVVQDRNKRNLKFMKMMQYQGFYKLNVGMVNAINAAFKEDLVQYSHMPYWHVVRLSLRYFSGARNPDKG
jgi:hypothetical protein